MKNDVLSVHGHLQGLYQISDPIKGKQSWTSGSNAIWYVQGKWQIGSLDNIGTFFGGIHAVNDYGRLDDDKNEWWYYDPGNGWFWAGANNVSIDCTSKN